MLECTPPFDTSPSRCRRPLSRPAWQICLSTSLSKKEPSSMASSMRVRSWRTIIPAPRLRWPTSELPI